MHLLFRTCRRAFSRRMNTREHALHLNLLHGIPECTRRACRSIALATVKTVPQMGHFLASDCCAALVPSLVLTSVAVLVPARVSALVSEHGSVRTPAPSSLFGSGLALQIAALMPLHPNASSSQCESGGHDSGRLSCSCAIAIAPAPAPAPVPVPVSAFVLAVESETRGEFGVEASVGEVGGGASILVVGLATVAAVLMMGALSGVSAAAAQRRLASRSVPNIPRTRFLPLFNCVRTDQHIDPLSSNCSTHVLRWVDGECIASIVYGK